MYSNVYVNELQACIHLGVTESVLINIAADSQSILQSQGLQEL